MNKEIYLNEEEVNKTLEALKNKKERLKEIIDKQKNLNKRMHEAWKGTSGDKAFEMIKKHEDKYELYLNSIEIRINFLEKVMKTYIGFDNYLNKKIDENSNIDA